jgi:hypothetical protein
MKQDDGLHRTTETTLDSRLRRLHRGLEPSADFDAALARRIAAERESIARAQAARAVDRERLERDLAADLRRLRRDAWLGAGLLVAGGTAAAAAAWQLVPALTSVLGTQAGAGAGGLELAWAFGAGALGAGAWLLRRLVHAA